MKLYKSKQFKGSWLLVSRDKVDSVLLTLKELKELKKKIEKVLNDKRSN